MNKVMTVEELYKRLEDLIVLGYGDKKVTMYVPKSRSSSFCINAFYDEEYDHVEVEGC